MRRGVGGRGCPNGDKASQSPGQAWGTTLGKRKATSASVMHTGLHAPKHRLAKSDESTGENRREPSRPPCSVLVGSASKCEPGLLQYWYKPDAWQQDFQYGVRTCQVEQRRVKSVSKSLSDNSLQIANWYGSGVDMWAYGIGIHMMDSFKTNGRDARFQPWLQENPLPSGNSGYSHAPG